MNKFSVLTLLLFSFVRPASADVVVLRDRSILRGGVTHSDSQITVGGKTFEDSEVLLWEGADGAPRNEPTLRDHLRGYAAMHDVVSLGRCKELIPQAIEANAGGSARKLLIEAERLGMEPSDVDTAAEKIEKLGDGKDAKFALGARASWASFLANKAKGNGALKESLRGLEILRAALVRNEKDPVAIEILDQVGPKTKKRRRRRVRQADVIAARKRKRVWLDWRVDVLPSKYGRIRMLDYSHPELERARELWKPRDSEGVRQSVPVYGVETDEIVFITSLERTDTVKHCVSIARFTARALEEMMKVDDPKRGTSDPLVIYLYANQKQYIELSGQGRGAAPNPTIAMSAGHYVPTENVSRFFWPNRPGAKDSVKETFVHELTHHWIQERNPRWARADQAMGEKSVTTPGSWIVEGMAVFMQESRFDLERGTWSHFNPKMLSLDSVDSIGRQKKLMDWKKLFTITKQELHEIVDTKKLQAKYEGRWNLFPIGMSEMLLFYKQSGSTCTYLYWAENGKYREALKEYVTSYYCGKKAKTSIQAAFGMTEAELGKRVEAFAKKVVDGWRPAGA
jgi:hypothetical protein